MKKLAHLASCALFLFSCFIWARHASALTVPERLVYDVTWTGVKSATTVHEVTAKGDELHMVSTTRSTPWLSTFFPIDDRAESVVIRGEGDRIGVPKYYKQKANEGNYRALREAHFDMDRLSVETRDLLKKTSKTDPIGPKTYDSLSIIYYIRSLDLEPGKTVHLDIYDAKRVWKGEVKVLRREEVSTPMGRFKTVVVQPVLRSPDGKPPRAGDMTVWLTDDERRIPVMMTTKAKLGKITATLAGGSHWAAQAAPKVAKGK